jgi:hypothetical protein
MQLFFLGRQISNPSVLPESRSKREFASVVSHESGDGPAAFGQKRTVKRALFTAPTVFYVASKLVCQNTFVLVPIQTPNRSSDIDVWIHWRAYRSIYLPPRRLPSCLRQAKRNIQVHFRRVATFGHERPSTHARAPDFLPRGCLLTVGKAETPIAVAHSDRCEKSPRLVAGHHELHHFSVMSICVPPRRRSCRD